MSMDINFNYVLPKGMTYDDYYAGDTHSFYIKRFASVISPYYRPGTLTKSEVDKITINLLSFMVETVDNYFLKFAARFLTPDDFDDIVAERNIIHTCGYPLCAKVPVVCVSYDFCH